MREMMRAAATGLSVFAVTAMWAITIACIWSVFGVWSLCALPIMWAGFVIGGRYAHD